jgi:hypothetical protein
MTLFNIAFINRLPDGREYRKTVTMRGPVESLVIEHFRTYYPKARIVYVEPVRSCVGCGE